jgi:hypothetical protein
MEGRMFGLFKKKISVPSQDWRNYANAGTHFTPDIVSMEQHNHQLLFTPDELKRGHSKNSLISDGKFIAVGFTQSPFSFWEKQLGTDSFPVPIQEKVFTDILRDLPPSCRIKGEIHALRPSNFLTVDEHKQNGVQFIRRRVKILIPSREIRTYDLGDNYPKALQGKKTIILPEKVTIIRAWMYIGVQDYWKDLLDAGFSGFKAVNNYSKDDKPWLTRYYDYPKVPYKGS